MLIALALAVQAAAAPPPAGETIDLLADTRSRCAGEHEGDIVVCGSAGDPFRYRLRPLPEPGSANVRPMLALPGGGSLAPTSDVGRLGDLQLRATLKVPF